MSKYFYVSDGASKIGPFSREEVLQMLFNAHISLTDFVLDSRDNRMCPILQHEDFGGAGGTSPADKIKEKFNKPTSNSDQFGFSELRKQGNKFLRNNNAPADRIRREKESSSGFTSKHRESASFSDINLKKSEKNLPTPDLKESNSVLTNNSTNFYVLNRDREYGPIKFLVLLSLLKQNKLKPEIKTRTENNKDYCPLSHFLPKELLQTIQITPVINPEVLPKNRWQRKNLRIDYDELVLLNNQKYSLVARSLDLSTGGLSVLWVYNIPNDEIFEISLFDKEQNILTVQARLTRKEIVQSDSPLTLYKAVFLFSKNIQIKNFIN